MWRRIIGLGLLSASVLAGTSVSAAPREHPRGLWGQDELRRSIRQLENDWDRLMEAWDRSLGGLHGTEDQQALARAELLAIDATLDEMRDAYVERSEAETLRTVDELLPREEPLFIQLIVLDPPQRLREAWDQVHADLRRLSQEAAALRGEGQGSLRRVVVDPDRSKIAVAEIEDLSDELKRYLLRTDEHESDWEPQVTKAGGRARHRTHSARLERAVLEFEEAADELKALHRKHERPEGTRPLIDRLARAARTIDFSMGEASVPEEARREWREIVPELERVLTEQRSRGIGAGWETHR